MTAMEDVVAQALKDLLGAIGQTKSPSEPGAVAALAQLEDHAFAAAKAAVVTFIQIRMVRTQADRSMT